MPWHRLYRPQMAPQPVRNEDELAWLPWAPPDTTAQRLAGETPDRGRLATMWTYYFSAISFIDSWIGMILDELEALGLRERTLIVYTSDHGEFLGDHWSFGKTSFLEPAARVPLILSWPGHLPARTVREQLVGGSDIVPTLLAASAIEPSASGLDPDGVNLLPVARDNGPARDILIGQVGRGVSAQLGAITREWKYVYSCGANRELLFKYRDGERELRNYAEAADSTAAAACADLRQVIIERYRRDGATELLTPDGQQLKPFPDAPPPGGRGMEPEIWIKERLSQYARWPRALPAGWAAPPPSAAGDIPADLPRHSRRDRYQWPAMSA
ncbi:MAG: hypothetical protein CL878_06975 [Dehalococcoidia bacterium]|nr:hypothetical protein [Dehalococcoidia bacterium]